MLLLLKSPAGTWLTWRFWFLHGRQETLSLAVLLGLLTNVSAVYDANFFLLQVFCDIIKGQTAKIKSQGSKTTSGY